jgi:hypothetical protein
MAKFPAIEKEFEFNCMGVYSDGAQTDYHYTTNPTYWYSALGNHAWVQNERDSLLPLRSVTGIDITEADHGFMWDRGSYSTCYFVGPIAPTYPNLEFFVGDSPQDINILPATHCRGHDTKWDST